MTMPHDSNNIREIILDAADNLLARSGYKRMKIEDLAREARIGKGSIYLHFESKEEIALAHLDRLVTEIREHLGEIAISPNSASDRLFNIMLDRIMLRFDNVQRFSRSLNELLENVRPGLLERRNELVDVEAEMIAKVVSEGQKTGEFAEGDAKVFAKTLVDATASLLPFSLRAFEKEDRVEVNRRTVAVTELLINGLRYRRQ